MTTESQRLDICKRLFGGDTLKEKEVEICKDLFGGDIVEYGEKPEKYYVTEWILNKVESENEFLKTMKSLCGGESVKCRDLFGEKPQKFDITNWTLTKVYSDEEIGENDKNWILTKVDADDEFIKTTIESLYYGEPLESRFLFVDK